MILVSTGLIGKPLKDDNLQTKVMNVVSNCFLTTWVETQSGRIYFYN